jgi:hypothetical protein
MSVHLDGLQQSKAIVKEAGETFSNTLKRMNMSSIATAMNGGSIAANEGTDGGVASEIPTISFNIMHCLLMRSVLIR